jgi:hypothetical protein
MKKITIFVILLVITLSSSGCIETGKGKAKDQIHSIEEDGLVWKTWSVWLVNDHPCGSPGSDNYYSSIYSVDKENTDLIEKLKIAAGTDQVYIIEYTNHALYYPWEYNSGVFITNIEQLN